MKSLLMGGRSGSQVSLGGLGRIKLILCGNLILRGRLYVGGLSAHMEGPSKPELVFKNQEDGQVICSYQPSAPGNYKLHLKFQHYHLPGIIKYLKVNYLKLKIKKLN